MSAERKLLLPLSLIPALAQGAVTHLRAPIDRIGGLGAVTEFQQSDTPGYDWIMRDRRMLWNDLRHEDLMARNPFGRAGTVLWVPEPWWQDRRDELAAVMDLDGHAVDSHPMSKATGKRVDVGALRSNPNWYKRAAVHMPRWAARLTLVVCDVRVARLQDMTDREASASGIDHLDGSPLRSFMTLWESLHGPDSWSANPWVWSATVKSTNAQREQLAAA